MTIEMQHNITTVNWEKLAEVFEKAPLGKRDPDQLKKVFENSRYCCFLYDRNRIIGAARALSDGYDCAVICDVVVLPEYQSQGIGQKLTTQFVAVARTRRLNVIILNTDAHNNEKANMF